MKTNHYPSLGRCCSTTFLLLFFTHLLFAQDLLLVGITNDNLVSINPNTASTKLIHKIDLPPGEIMGELVYYQEDCAFYSIIRRGEAPVLVSFDWQGNYQEIGRMTSNSGTVFIAEGLSINPTNGILYAGVSLDGQDFTSESLVEVDRTNGKCTLLAKIFLPGTQNDIDNMGFDGNILYINDGDPGANTSVYARFDFANLAGPTFQPEIIFTEIYRSHADFGFINSKFYLPVQEKQLFQFDQSIPQVTLIGTTHTNTEFGGERITGLTAVPEFRDFTLVSDKGPCTPAPATLTANAVNLTTIWSNGEEGLTLTTGIPGSYHAEIYDGSCLLYTTPPINITFSGPLYSGENHYICSGDTLSINGVNYTTGGVFSQTILTNYGCDSTLQINIEEGGEKFSETFEFCQGTVFNHNGRSYDQPIIFADTIFVDSGCDTIFETILQWYPEEFDFLGPDQVSCAVEVYLESPFNETKWPDNSTGQHFTVSESGNYQASGIDINGCRQEDTVSIEFIQTNVYLPNAFSPNGDGINDHFHPILSDPTGLEAFEFSIFNRWGALVFHTKDIGDYWEGRFRGEKAAAGIYVWMLRYHHEVCGEVFDAGDVLLVD